MKKILILGSGAGGTMVANHLRKKLSPNHWEITIIDRDDGERPALRGARVGEEGRPDLRAAVVAVRVAGPVALGVVAVVFEGVQGETVAVGARVGAPAGAVDAGHAAESDEHLALGLGIDLGACPWIRAGDIPDVADAFAVGLAGRTVTGELVER